MHPQKRGRRCFQRDTMSRTDRRRTAGSFVTLTVKRVNEYQRLSSTKPRAHAIHRRSTCFRKARDTTTEHRYQRREATVPPSPNDTRRRQASACASSESRQVKYWRSALAPGLYHIPSSPPTPWAHATPYFSLPRPVFWVPRPTSTRVHVYTDHSFCLPLSFCRLLSSSLLSNVLRVSPIGHSVLENQLFRRKWG